MARQKKWVVKVGSQMVSEGGAVLIRSWMHQVRTLFQKHDIQVVWVTSGAIAAAVHRTDFKKPKSGWTVSEKQALSAIGQPLLMDEYKVSLNSLGMIGAQVLLSYQDIASKNGRTNFTSTIRQLLKWNVVPLVNENDAVATEEIKFGDNDSLSAHVAGLIQADKLVLMTDVHGFYSHDPKINPNAELLKTLDKIPDSLLKSVSKQGGNLGTGGMFSKLKAAKEAAKLGIETLFVKGDLPNVLLDIAQGGITQGTRVMARKARS